MPSFNVNMKLTWKKITFQNFTFPDNIEMTDIEQQLILFSVFIENTYFFIDKEDLAYYFDKYYKY